jgi:putative ABC transport system substrate-binding protein
MVGLMLSACLIVLAACGGNADSKSGSGSGGKTYSIGISQIAAHPSLDATYQGFLAALADAGIVEGENLKVDYNVAAGDQTNNLSIAQKLASANHDLVLAIATPSAQAVAQYVTKTPVLFSAVTDPVDAGIVTNLEKPGGNITGASDTNPEAIVQLMDFIAKEFPDTKNVGLIINTGEPNAVVMAEIAEEALAKYNIGLVKAPVANTSEVKQAAESLVGRADVFFITLDNTVVDALDSILQVVNEKDIPFFSSDRDSVERGAFATYGFRYYDHGYEVGQMAVEILKNGKNPGDMAVTKPTKLDFILNLKAAEEQNIVVTDAMKAYVQDPANNLLGAE